jgi:glycosyltransferase involved in cell wall biosynthesis
VTELVDRVDICFVSSEHPALDKRVFQKEARGLADAGWNVVHLCPGTADARWVDHGVTLQTYGRRRRGKLGRLFALGTLYRQAAALNARAYHCNEVDSWVVGVLLRISKRAVLVFDAHEHYPSGVVRWVPPALVGPATLGVRAVLQVLGLFTHLVVLAKASIAGDYSWSRRRHLVILNSTALRDVPAPTQHDSMDRLRFVHTGVISRDRGAFVLLEALAELRRRSLDAEVVIVGGFNDGSEDEFDKLAAELGVAGMLTKLGWVGYDEAFDIVRSCHVGLVLFTKRIENNIKAMPHKMFDYMAAGLAVVAPDFAPEVRTILDDAGCALMVDTDDPHAVATALARLAEEPGLAEHLGLAGRAAVERSYSWEIEAAKLTKVYDCLLRA